MYLAWDDENYPDDIRCPWALMSPEVLLCVQWWRMWRDLGALPYGGNDLMAQPAYVTQAIVACQEECGRVVAARSRVHNAEIRQQTKALEEARRNRGA